MKEAGLRALVLPEEFRSALTVMTHPRPLPRPEEFTCSVQTWVQGQPKEMEVGLVQEHGKLLRLWSLEVCGTQEAMVTHSNLLFLTGMFYPKRSSNISVFFITLLYPLRDEGCFPLIFFSPDHKSIN